MDWWKSLQLRQKIDSLTPQAKRSLVIALLVFLTLFGGVLRFYDLGEESFWADEAYTALFVQDKPLGAMLTGRAQDRVNPPLFYILSKPMLSVHAQAEVALRILPALFGVLLIPAVFWLTHLISRSRVASLWAASMTTLAPPLIHYSQEARSYALYTLLAALFVGAAHRTLTTGSKRWIAVTSIIGMLGVYTHYGFFTLLAAYALVAAFRGTTLKQKAMHLLPVAVAGLTFLPWFFVSTYPRLIQTKKLPFWQPPVRLTDVAEHISSGFLGIEIGVFGFGVIAFVVLYTAIKRQHLLLVSAIVIPFVLFAIKGTWLPRYTLFAIPLIFVLIAALTGRGKLKWLPVLLLFLTTVSFLPWAREYYGVPQSEQWRPAIAAITAQDNGRGKIYINRQFHRFPVKWYYRGKSKRYLPKGSHIRTRQQYAKNMRTFPWVIIIEARQNKRSAVLLQSARDAFSTSQRRHFGEITIHRFSQ